MEALAKFPLKSTEIERAIREIRNFTEAVTVLLNKPEQELQVLPLDVSGLQQPAASPEMVDILKEMRRLSSTAVAILDRPVNEQSGMQPAPVVHVSAPSVSVSPNISIAQPARRWRFTVTQRDNSAQMRIKEIVVESLE